MGQQKKIYFILGLHNHQPVGNLPDVFSLNYRQSYQPFLATLERFPRIKVALHYSGSLLEWLEQEQPAFIGRLRALVERGQVEILGGAYYEPILPIIPEEDQIGQIQMLSGRLNELLGRQPRGMWLAERVWEPHLARPIREAGLEYLAVDDAHFIDAGIPELDYYYRTEEGGRALDIFPINEELRYLIPFKPPQETIDFFAAHRDQDQRLFVLADDGEKFGGWPNTYETVYEQGWLEQFFTLLEQSRDWLKVVTFTEFRQLFLPGGPVYLPVGSYREMKKWSGGFWRNFLTRYPESNRMHKKMLAVRRELERLPSGDTYEQARRLIWAGQCNCSYWHGVFGGLYLNFLRAAVWEKLLEAEKVIDSSLKPSPFVGLSCQDRCYDGEYEIEVKSDRLVLLMAPHLGGSLWELSWRPAAVNLLDTLTRRPEAYHHELIEQAAAPAPPEDEVVSIHHLNLVKEEGLVDHLRYDPYPRGALIDHFLAPGVSLEEFQKGEYSEAGDFLLKPAVASFERLPAADHNNKEGIRVIFRRAGRLDDRVTLLLEKALTLYAGEDGLEVQYNLENLGRDQVDLRFAVEFNLAFLGGYDEERFFEIPGRRLEERHLASVGSEEDVNQLLIRDCRRNLGLVLSFSEPAGLWRMPVETISLSESGMERSYQQSLLLPRWEFSLSPGQVKRLRLSLRFGEAGLAGEAAEAKDEVRA